MRVLRPHFFNQIPNNFTGIVEWPKSGEKWWLQNGLLHRLDGPAMEYLDGKKRYWVFDWELAKEQWEVFRFLWENTSYEKDRNLVKIFLDLIFVRI